MKNDIRNLVNGAMPKLVIPEPSLDNTIDININSLSSFNGHPFIVKDDDSMDQLVDSIETQGIITPIVVRELKEGHYEIVSGHRRVHAAKRLHMDRVPAYIVEMDDDQATIAMVDSNIQRVLLPSEKAFSLKMKLEAIKHQGTSGHNVLNFGQSRDDIGESMGLSGRQVTRYIKLTHLIRPILNRVDSGELSMAQGLKIADLSEESQRLIDDYIVSTGKVTDEVIDKLISVDNGIENLEDIFETKSTSSKPKRKKLYLSRTFLKEFFDAEMSNGEIENIIRQLLTDWKRS